MSNFFDSNILIYAQEQGPKGETARACLAKGGVISVQVLNEFASVMHRKYKRTWPEIEEALSDVELVIGEILPVTMQIHRMALILARDHNINIYDALIIAAALDADCDILYSEDLQHGRKFGDLLVVNPFASSP